MLIDPSPRGTTHDTFEGKTREISRQSIPTLIDHNFEVYRPELQGISSSRDIHDGNRLLTASFHCCWGIFPTQRRAAGGWRLIPIYLCCCYSLVRNKGSGAAKLRRPGGRGLSKESVRAALDVIGRAVWAKIRAGKSGIDSTGPNQAGTWPTLPRKPAPHRIDFRPQGGVKTAF